MKKISIDISGQLRRLIARRKETKPKLSAKEKRQRNISRGLIVLFCLLIALAIFAIGQADLHRAGTVPEVMKKSPIAANKKRDYGEAGFVQVAENEQLLLFADFTNGEIYVEQKATGKKWYSNPPERTEPGIKGVKGRLNSQLILTYANVSSADPNIADNYTISVKQGGMDHELIENGVKFTFAFPPAGIIVPLEYTLDGDALRVRIAGNEIQELWSDRFIATSIDVLPFFGASGEKAEGYMLLPDGSGALVPLNSSNYTMSQYMSPVYGNDASLEYDLTVQRKKNVAMPVFGLKWNDDGFVAVIEEGESNARIYSYLSRKITSFNQVYAQMLMRTVKLKQVGGMGENYGAIVAGDNRDKMEDWSDFLYRDTDFVVSYFFLSGEDADYSGMSNRYRSYLETRRQKTQSELPPAQYLTLDVYGAVSIERYVMGIKTPIITPLTTYRQVCDMVDELQARGVDHLIINYIGALRGGLEREMTDKVEIEPVLGSRADFEHMLSYLKERGVILFIEAEPVEFFEDGGGYRKTVHCARSYFDSLTVDITRGAQPNEGKVVVGKTAFYLKPRYVTTFMERFAASAAKKQLEGVSIGHIGGTIYSDIARTEPDTIRAETSALWQEAMANVKAQGPYLMVHQGNAYCFPYADIITDVATEHSDYDSLGRSVPFYQIALHGDILMTTEPLNDSADYRYMTLKAIESGVSPKFNVMAAESKVLVGTIYNNMTSYAMEHWLDTIVDSYQMVQRTTGSLAAEKIEGHREIAPDVTETAYASGDRVYVNFGDAEYQGDGFVVPARDALLVKGEKQ